MFSTKIISDVINPSGCRLTTWELKYPRVIHSELLTHEILIRNAASSRAIPSKKRIQSVIEDPFIPIEWGLNKPGMVATEVLTYAQQEKAFTMWMRARSDAIDAAKVLDQLNVHKQIVNRVIEPFSWITSIFTGTDWANWYALRTADDAEPHFRHLARMMYEIYMDATPHPIEPGYWATPFVTDEEVVGFGVEARLKISTARCARVSYLNHDQTNPDPYNDMRLHDKLLGDKHLSPFAHPAMALGTATRIKQFRGFLPYRELVKPLTEEG